MLKYNTTSLPDQALYCLRYYLLYDWHVCNEYSDLENNEDIDAKSFVHMFDNFRRNVEEDRRTWNSILIEKEYEHLWEGRYSLIASKYNCDGKLCW